MIHNQNDQLKPIVNLEIKICKQTSVDIKVMDQDEAVVKIQKGVLSINIALKKVTNFCFFFKLIVDIELEKSMVQYLNPRHQNLTKKL